MSYAPQPPGGYAPPPKKSSTMLIVLIVVGVVALLGLCCVGGGLALLLPAIEQARQAAARVESQNDLKVLGLAYHQFRDAQGKSPASWEELSSSGIVDAATIQRLQAQNYVVAWNLDINQIATGPVPTYDYVLAHPADASTEPVSVLMADGSVQVLPPDELQRRLGSQAASPAAAP